MEAVFAFLLGLVPYEAGAEMHNPTCHTEQIRTVSMEGQGYVYDVGNCEYQANKDKYTVIKW